MLITNIYTNTKIIKNLIKLGLSLSLCLFLSLLILVNIVIANENKYDPLKMIRLPKHKSVPGGIAIIPLDLNTIDIPKVFFNNQQILVINYNNSKSERDLIAHKDWIAIVGIPMETKPGLHKISIFLNQNQIEGSKFEDYIEKSFLVTNHKYPTERLKLLKKFTNPSYAEQLRINQDQQLIKKAYEYRSVLIPNLGLFKPVEGRKTSPFGLKRILNGKHKGFHSGLDLAAAIGTKVMAASYGRVILIGNFFYTGNSVFIDHGQGLITSYAHLNSIQVKEGDLVNNKTVIGNVGMTGRSTGPHLHWSVSINNVRVNPELFLD